MSDFIDIPFVQKHVVLNGVSSDPIHIEGQTRITAEDARRIVALGTPAIDKLGKAADALDYELMQKMEQRIAALEAAIAQRPLPAMTVSTEQPLP